MELPKYRWNFILILELLLEILEVSIKKFTTHIRLLGKYFQSSHKSMCVVILVFFGVL